MAGFKIDRVYTADCGWEPLLEWKTASAVLREVDGTEIARYDGLRVPAAWSQNAVDILATKYLRKSGVPGSVRSVEEPGVPTWLQASVPSPDAVFGMEKDAAEVFNRLAGCWTYWGWKLGYFDSEASAVVFYDELCYLMATQRFAPASPQWFNTGLHWAYGIEGKRAGQWFAKTDQDGRVEAFPCLDSYSHPQAHACYIQRINDNLLGEQGIMDLLTREARVFRGGGGSGSNFSSLRGKGEPLAAGGKSSGLLSWLGIANRAAGAIKSGGTTRRAAKMVVVDVDHPDIEEFILWKVIEEQKVAALVAGSKLLARHMNGILSAHVQGAEAVKRAIAEARADAIPEGCIVKAGQLAKQGVKSVEVPVYTTDFDKGGAYETVDGQNANNSVRVTDEFMRLVEVKGRWHLVGRVERRNSKAEGRKPKTREVDAAELWEKIGWAAWHCADPGLQFHDTINAWHTCPEDGEIEASNPCSEYMFLDDTGCNLASLNLLGFFSVVGSDGRGIGTKFDVNKFRHAVSLATVVLDITVSMAGYVSKEIAERSHYYRTLGLGYGNLGALLMTQGLAYDSEEGRALAGALTALMHFESARTSAILASFLGPFPRYEANKEHIDRVFTQHAQLANGVCPVSRFQMPDSLRIDLLPDYLREAVRDSVAEGICAIRQDGLRNAQLSLLAPTGTIGLLMDCDTTGIEPDFSLVKFKKLAGGGYMKIVNGSLELALATLGYGERQTEEIKAYCLGIHFLKNAPHHLAQRIESRLGASYVKKIETRLVSYMDLRSCFDRPEDWESLGLTPLQYADCNRYCCGTMTVEGAPHLKPEHLPVFDCASRCGATGKRMISTDGHLDMMGAVQGFLSGAISKTINMPSEATQEEVLEVYKSSWERGLKAVAAYRDGSKLSQPLQTGGVEEGGVQDFTRPPALRAAERIVYRYIAKRRKLPSRRSGETQKFEIGGHNFYLRTGDYPDGSLGEIFLDCHLEGAAFRAFMNAFAIAISLGLQHGVPLEEYVDAFCGMRFEPNGVVGCHAEIKMATSVIDAMFRDLAIHYLDRKDLANVDMEGGHLDAASVVADASPRSDREEWEEESETPPPGVTTALARRNGSEIANARLKGYEGQSCRRCGEFMLRRAGSCLECENCHWNEGCG